ncbi:MAG TPA: maleylpyruvate isomerase family mycothiol-dependent enzyme, partial [Pseudonocardiaceae bacterium]
MRVYDMVVAERLRAADLLDGLTGPQWRSPTLCGAWTVHDVAAHLVSYLRLGRAKLYAGLVATAADLDRMNLILTRRYARLPSPTLVSMLRRGAGSRLTIPRSGYDPALADVVLHELDVRRPLGLPGQAAEDRLWVAFQHLAVRPSPGFTMGARLAGLRLHATDTGWTHGDGPLVAGPAADLLLAMAGRAVR